MKLGSVSAHGPALRGLFVTGTDTGVGKTYVAALVARQLAAGGTRVAVYKPVASGCVAFRSETGPPFAEQRESAMDDAALLWEAVKDSFPADLADEHFAHVCPQRFVAPLAPHLAARREGRQVDAALLRRGLDYWRERSKLVIVEGAGGLLSPLTDTESNADLARDFGFPLLVVARNALGTINHTLLTLRVAATCGLRVAAIVLNDVASPAADESTRFNADELRLRCAPVPVVQLGHGDKAFSRSVDWRSLAD
jgi:dethiobiotin synthetase